MTQFSLSQSSQVPFVVTAEPESKAADRFRIILSTKPLSVYVNRNAGKERFDVYPNPVTNGHINLQIVNGNKSTYQVEVVNSLGQVMFRKNVQHPGGASLQPRGAPTIQTNR